MPYDEPEEERYLRLDMQAKAKKAKRDEEALFYLRRHYKRNKENWMKVGPLEPAIENDARLLEETQEAHQQARAKYQTFTRTMAEALEKYTYEVAIQAAKSAISSM